MVILSNKTKLRKRKNIIRFSFVLIISLTICTINFFCLSKDDIINNAETSCDPAEVQQDESKNEENIKTENIEVRNIENKEDTEKEKKSNSNQSIEISATKSNVVDSQISQVSSSANYTHLYPDLYCQRPKTQITPVKTIFLTFDDGPSERTPEVLDILNRYGIKATFFVTGNASPQGKALMKRIVDEGHTIGVHTYTHNFRQVYASVEAFLEDFNNIYHLIYEATGIKPSIFRFPGGSKNSFNKNNYRELITEMTRRGFDYFDWNLSAGDAVSRTPTPAQRCASNILNYSAQYNDAVVLMHDARPKRTTVEALPAIIDGLKNQGFSFDKLSNDINPTQYSLVKPYR